MKCEMCSANEIIIKSPISEKQICMRCYKIETKQLMFDEKKKQSDIKNKALSLPIDKIQLERLKMTVETLLNQNIGIVVSNDVFLVQEITRYCNMAIDIFINELKKLGIDLVDDK